VRHLSHRIVVLYRGRVMEEGVVEVVYHRPAHPYTRALLAAAPVPDPELQLQRRLARLKAQSTAEPIGIEACPFAPRCPHAIDRCRSERPLLEPTPEGRLVACHRWREVRAETPEIAVPAPSQVGGAGG
jgi:oligopeptide/dipeptide ABC transporter ATP-binding protein